MRVHEIMTKHVRTISPAIDADTAWREMRKEHLHHLVVIEPGRRVVGVVSDRDLGGDDGAPLRLDKQVRDLMRAPVVTVAPDDTVRRAANLLRGHEIGSLPVLDDGGKLVGILTTTDILDMIGRGMEEPPRESDRRTLRDRGPRKAAQHRVARAASRYGRQVRH